MLGLRNDYKKRILHLPTPMERLLEIPLADRMVITQKILININHNLEEV